MRIGTTRHDSRGSSTRVPRLVFPRQSARAVGAHRVDEHDRRYVVGRPAVVLEQRAADLRLQRGEPEDAVLRCARTAARATEQPSPRPVRRTSRTKTTARGARQPSKPARDRSGGRVGRRQPRETRATQPATSQDGASEEDAVPRRACEDDETKRRGRARREETNARPWLVSGRRSVVPLRPPPRRERDTTARDRAKLINEAARWGRRRTGSQSSARLTAPVGTQRTSYFSDRTARAWKELKARERPDSARRRAVAEVAHAVVQDDRPVVPRVEHGARGLGWRERHHCRRRRRGAGAGGVQNRGGRDERRAAKGEHR